MKHRPADLLRAYASALGQPAPAPWYTLTRNDAGTGTAAALHVYGVIGWDVEAGALVAELDALDAATIDVYVNSPGGLLFDGVAIFNALSRHPATVNVTVDGLAASAASLIAMAGDQITMGVGSQMMIHDAAVLAAGNPAELRDLADWLDGQSDNAAAIYAARAGGTRAEWRARMTAETWYSADQAVEAGLATSVATPNDSSSGSDSGSSSSSATNWAGRLVALATTTTTAQAAHNRKETTTMDDDQLEQLEATVTDLTRRVDLIAHQGGPGAGGSHGPTASRFGTAAAILKAIAAGDADAAAEYTSTINAYTGGTTADDGTLPPTWIGDLTKIIDEAAGLAGWFSSSPLPAEGMTLEFGKLDSNTVTVAKQAAQGDPLPFGKVTVKTASTDVETYGGYTELSVQEVKRTRVNMLDLALRALAVQSGKAFNAAFRTHYAASVTAASAGTHLVLNPATATWENWLDALVDASDIFDDNGLSLDALILKTADFKALMHLTDSTGRPYLDLNGSGTNNVGTIDLGGSPLAGKLGRLPVLKAKADALPTFANKLAIRSYRTPVAQLSDSDIVQLSQAYSVYYFAAIADEMPVGLVPLTAA